MIEARSTNVERAFFVSESVLARAMQCIFTVTKGQSYY